MCVAGRRRGALSVADGLKDRILVDDLASLPAQHIEQHVAEEQPFENKWKQLS